MLKSLYFSRSIKRPGVMLLVFAMLVSSLPVLLSFPAKAQAATTLVTYPAPEGVTLNNTYTVKVREPGGEWNDLDEYNTRVGYGATASNVSFVYFDTNGPVELSVTDNTGNIESAEIRPSHNNIIPDINGNTMTFTISGPVKLSVEVNGNVQDNLHIFANPLEVNPPNPDDPDVLYVAPGTTYTPSPSDPSIIYVAPGYHTQDFVVKSGKTLYIAGGAAIKGGIVLDNATNAKVIGRGVLDRPLEKAISADYTNQIVIDGIIANNYGVANNGGYGATFGNATNVLVNNYKAFSYMRWGDGIDIFSSHNITINDVFMRTSDDSIAIYNARPNGGRIWSGNSNNINVTNSILMPGLAHPINIATHGDPTKPGEGETLDTLNFSNLDVLLDKPYGVGPIRLDASDGNLIINVNFSDIRIEDRTVGLGKAVELRTDKNGGYGLAPGRGINNVYFKNVTYNGTNANGSNIYGYNSTRLTQNITFENLVINGTVVESAEAGNFKIGNYTQNINFIPGGGVAPKSAAEIPAPVPIDLAINKTATVDSSGHSWTVDLGSSMNITNGTQVTWGNSGVAYPYKIETSNDNTNWTLKSDKTDNTNTDQVQSDVFLDTTRYVRITVTGQPSGASEGLVGFKVLGEPTNLALSKTASADSSESENPASNGSDGNPTTLWRAADDAVDHSFTVDLGVNRNITYGTQVSWLNSGVAHQYKIETSKDAADWNVVVDNTGNTSTDQVQTDYFIDTARYVKITVTGLPSGARAGFYDFKVFGEPINLALNKPASADSSEAGYPASNGIDASTTTRWSAADRKTGHWYMVDLGSVMKITEGTQIMWERPEAIYKYKIETSTDGTNWTTKIDKEASQYNQGNTKSAQVQADYFTGTARYVRLTVSTLPDGAKASFYDFKVFGESEQGNYQVSFDTNGGEPALDAVTVPDGSLVNEPTNSIEKDYFTFKGWYNGEQKWDFAKDIVTNDMVLKAHWALESPEDITNVEVIEDSTVVKKEYRINDSLSVEGLSLKVSWSNGNEIIIPVTMDMVSGFNSSAPAESQTLTVTIDDRTATYTVSIVKPIKIDVYNEATIVASHPQWAPSGTTPEPKEVVGYRLFDGDTNTAGDLNAGRSYYDIDFGELRSVKLTDIRMLPRNKADNVNRMNGAYLLGSNDKQTWTRLTNNVSNATLGTWTIYEPDDILDHGAYRYFRLTNDSNWFGNVAELEFYGKIIQPQSVAVSSESTYKTQYQVGEPISVEGLSLAVNWSDGSKTTVPVTADMVSGFNSNAAVESQILTITYGGLTATYTVSIGADPGEKVITGISVSDSVYKTDYKVGEPLNVTGLALNVSWSDESTTTIPVTVEMVSGFNSSTAVESQILTITYGGFTATYTISIEELPAEKVITGITVSDSVYKTEYKVGEPLDVTGLTLDIAWSDGSNTVVPVTAEMVSGFNSSAAVESQILTITYGDYTATYTISIEALPTEKVMTSIVLNNSGYKTSYWVGEALDVTGLSLIVNWSDDTTTTVPVTAEMVSGFNSSAPAANQTLTVNYEGFHVVYTVSIVSRPVVQPSSVVVQPPVVYYVVSFDANGGTPAGSVKVQSGSMVSSMPTSEREGYIFEGWFTNGGTKFASSTRVYSNLTLVAKWSRTGEKAKPETPVVPGTTEKPKVQFTDVAESYWAKNELERLIEMGAISGFEDGSFRPDDSITRAEFLKIVVTALGLKASGTMVFEDTNQHWAKDYISTAGALDIISGRSKETFAPDAKVTRQEMSVILARAGKLTPKSEDSSNRYTDQGEIADWASKAINAMTDASITNGYPDGSFKPDQTATRAQAAVMIVRLLDYLQSQKQSE
ncbi:Listeria/Bacterioides repeat-containing protein [Fontibacillus panacisegetis]|uniref:Listeria/Bacterioides repeat-containing protein n=1 Tax=Fontibacillus panacisegetis TaxID=670482 RepID=A0A1G7SBF5_9BACL|nr:discoidin domain-containing protein [Fontibacillus panacisegetis]SDG20395.1 Listeria/Bacterioides repeat-containing protein [Fontibacillus panacisegetis]